jgi:hypothetical protein
MRGKFKCRDRIERIDRAAIGGYRHLPNQRIEVEPTLGLVDLLLETRRSASRTNRGDDLLDVRIAHARMQQREYLVLLGRIPRRSALRLRAAGAAHGQASTSAVRARTRLRMRVDMGR